MEKNEFNSKLSPLNQLKQYKKNKEPTLEVISTKTLMNFIKKKNEIDDSTHNILNNIYEVQKNISELKKRDENLQSKELERINKEFLKNGYERRFCANQEFVFSAIIGEDISKEMIKLKRDQNVDIFFN